MFVIKSYVKIKQNKPQTSKKQSKINHHRLQITAVSETYKQSYTKCPKTIAYRIQMASLPVWQKHKPFPYFLFHRTILI